MKKRAKRTGKPFPEQKEVKCYFQFVPPGEAGEPISKELFQLNLDARHWKIKQDKKRHAKNIAEKEKALAAREKDIKDKEKAFAETKDGKLWLGISAMLKAEMEKNPAKYDAEWLAKREESLRSAGIYDLAKLALETVALENEQKRETEALEKEFARGEEMRKANRLALKAVATMLAGLEEKRKETAEGLLRLATWITFQLQRFYKGEPELFHGITDLTDSIPVIAGLNPNWASEAEENLRRLKVGGRRAESRLKPIAYETEAYVCRAWAREVVKCMDANRWVGISVAIICEYLRETWKFVSYSVKFPVWLLEIAKLHHFNRTTAKTWASVARLVIRDEIPNFHERPEFARIVSNIRGRFRDAPGKQVKRTGTIQNGILDKIGEAIESIAGE